MAPIKSQAVAVQDNSDGKWCVGLAEEAFDAYADLGSPKRFGLTEKEADDLADRINKKIQIRRKDRKNQKARETRQKNQT